MRRYTCKLCGWKTRLEFAARMHARVTGNLILPQHLTFDVSRPSKPEVISYTVTYADLADERCPVQCDP